MVVTQLAEKILRVDGDERSFVIPQLNYWLVPLLHLFSQYQSRILVLVSTRSQISILEKEFKETTASIRIILDEDFLRQPETDYYDYLFFIGECLSKDWTRYAKYLVSNEIPTDRFVIIKEPVTQLAEVQYDQQVYTLNDRDVLFRSMARQASKLAYISPNSQILLLVPSPTDVESLLNLLRKARLPIPVNTLNNTSSGPGIIIAEREAGLLMASRLNPDYTFDTLIKKRWFPTWTQGRRRKETFVSKEEAEMALPLGGVLHRMMTHSLYMSLDDRVKRKTCLWRDWLLRDSTKTKPIPIERCWSQVSLEQGGISDIDPGLRDFLLRQNLGFRPALVLWKWFKDSLPLFPMISMIALIDSYGPSYFQYPPRTPEYEHRASEYQTLRQRHSERYFSEFAGKNDLEVLLKIWLSLLDFAGGFDDVLDHVETWTLQHSMHRDKILEVYTVARDLLTYFEIIVQGPIQRGPFDINDFLNKAYSYFEAVYSDRLIKPLHQGSTTYQRDFQTYLWAGLEYTMAPNPSGPAYALVVNDSSGPCLLWVSLPQEQEEQEEQVEVKIIA